MRHLRTGVLLGCLAVAALLAYFFAPAANRAPSTGDAPEAGAPPVKVPSVEEAPGLAPSAPKAGTGRAKATPGPETAKEAPASPRAVRIVGSVTAAKETPSPDATVVLRIGDRAEQTIATDAKGAFSFDAERPEGDPAPGLILAHDAAGRVAARFFGWRTSPGPFMGVETDYPKTLDVGALPLFAAAALDVVVKDAAGAPVAAEVWVTAAGFASGAVPLARARADEAGRAHLEGLVPWAMLVIAWAPGVGRGTASTTLPREAKEPLEVLLAATRDVEVTVLEKGTRAAIPGADLFLSEALPTVDGGTRLPYVPSPSAPPTDAQGRTTLHEIALGTSIRVRATAPGFADPSANRFGGGGDTLPPQATTLEILLERERRVTWVVGAGEVAPPPDGTELVLRASIGTGSGVGVAKARMEGGRIVGERVSPGNVSCVAFAPDGSQAHLYASPGTTEGHPTAFVRARRVDVTLLWSDGTPAAGLWVSLRNQGNNAFGPAVETDAQGRATWKDLEAQMADVYVATSNHSYAGRRIAACALAKEDGRVEVRLPRPREVIVRVYLDGQPGLPDNVFAGWGTETKVLERDPVAGTLRLSLWPTSEDAPTPLSVSAPGWLVDGPLKVPPASSGGTSEVRADLHRAGSLAVEIVPPPDKVYRLRLERWDPDKHDWIAAGYDTQAGGAGQAPVDAKGFWRLATLKPDRYRVRDAYSSALSDEVDVAAGAAATPLRFDLSAVGWVSGRVVVPAGESAGRIGVQFDPAPPPDAWGGSGGGTSTDAEGKFRLRVPGDREFVIRGVHQFLMPAVEGGRARVRAGATDAVLRMVKGPVAHVRFDREPRYDVNPGESHTEKAYLWRGPMQGPPALTVNALVEGATARLSNFEPGTWTVMLDLAPCAPVVLENVALGAAETNLGPVTLTEGTSLVFEVRVPQGQSVPRISVWARRVDASPEYQRFGEVGAKGRIPGLGRGRWKVNALPVMGGAQLLDREIEVDGTTDVPFVLEVK